MTVLSKHCIHIITQYTLTRENEWAADQLILCVKYALR